MGIEHLHREYAAQLEDVQVVRDVMAGEKVVKAKTTVYLPMPSGQSAEDYAAYKTRALFYGSTARTLEGYMGLVFRKKPALTDEKKILAEYTKDVTTTGLSLDDFARTVLVEVLSAGRVGILNEYPVADGLRTVSDVKNDGLRPYLALYTFENILDWRFSSVKNRQVLTFLKLREYVEVPDPSDEWAVKLEEQYRVFRLSQAGLCTYEVWRKENGTNWTKQPVEDPFVYINDEPIDFIPFVFITPVATEATMRKPPLLDLAMMNVHHYQVSADRVHACHWADNPTPVIVGQLVGEMGEEVKTIKLGSSSAINLAMGGDAKFLEMQGNGIGPTKELLADIAQYMAILGSKILSSDAAAAEAAETAAIHRAGEHSVLAAVANSVANALTQVLNVFIKFLGEDGEVQYRLNTDFYPSPMDSQTIIALIGALQSGAISDVEFFESMVQGEIVRPDKTFEQHKEELAATPKQTPVVASGSGNEFGTMKNAETGAVGPVEKKGVDSATS